MLASTFAKDFLDTVLKGWAAAVFWDKAAVGLIALLLVFLNPWAGATALLASVVATATAVALRTPRHLLRTGLYGTNGALVGLVATWYVPAHPLLLTVVAMGAAVTALLTSLWIERVSTTTQLPVLTLPFLLVSWALFAALRPLDPALTSSFYYQFGWTVRIEEHFRSVLPVDLAVFLRSLSWLFFQDSAVLGAAALGIIVARSRVMAGLALLGFVIGLAIARTAGASIADRVPVLEMSVGFNAALIAVCLGGLLVKLSWAALGFAVAGAAAGSLVTVAWALPLTSARLPLLNGPSVLVTLAFLALAHSRFLKLPKARIEAIPLDKIRTPEDHVELPWSKDNGELRLALPFYGVWYVAQGTHGLLTHWGNGSYAWDFVVVDSEGGTCRGLGRKADDYYAFGLPILAPAAGLVADVVDSVADNAPPEVNREQNWGNYVILDHGGGHFSELSHFRCGGIVVKLGEKVAAGQLIGYLGNSGLSMEPHLHYQLQRGPVTGAKTVAAKFWGYYRHKGGNAVYVKKGTPQQGELVGGIELDLASGQRPSQNHSGLAG